MRFGKFHILWVILVFASCNREREVSNLVRASEPGFTGLERCAICHTDKYAEWRQSLHSVAMTVPSDSTIVSDFWHCVPCVWRCAFAHVSQGRCVLYGD